MDSIPLVGEAAEDSVHCGLVALKRLTEDPCVGILDGNLVGDMVVVRNDVGIVELALIVHSVGVLASESFLCDVRDVLAVLKDDTVDLLVSCD